VHKGTWAPNYKEQQYDFIHDYDNTNHISQIHKTMAYVNFAQAEAVFIIH
jgi:hypothetical protein